jgi:DNA topoisomerase-1
MKTLLIVESPAKSKTIEKLLGPDYIVKASFGHIRELGKKNELGIETQNGFRPVYYKMATKNKQIQDLEDTMKKVDRVLLAADEDREGEAIAWHCAVVLKMNTTQLNRICFHEITETALKKAVSTPRQINMNMVQSQQARQILDKLVGFELSPLLWKSIGPGLSAGRVQSVCLKLIVEKEREIERFEDRRYFRTVGYFKNNILGVLNIQFNDEEQIKEFYERIKNSTYFVEKIESKRVEKRPPPPYTTSSIQQDLGQRFNLPSKKIMSVLQHLYEQGKITYHRTDSTTLSEHIMKEIKDYLIGNPEFGKSYFHPRNYKTKSKSAQEAHEAIRPTYIHTVNLDETFDEIDRRIYQMIWKRTVASQMAPCVSDVYTMIIAIENHPEKFLAKAERIISEGYKKIYDDNIKKEDGEEEELVGGLFGEIKEGDRIDNEKVVSTEKYQSPPLRYSEASIIKKMEVVGIGRPSTYASILSKLFERQYIEKKNIPGKKQPGTCWTLEKNKIKSHKIDILIGNEKNKLVPTEIGKRTNDYLNQNFDMIVNEEFTSDMENKLDQIANGELVWNYVIDNYYNTFHPNVEKLNASPSVLNRNNNTDKKCIGQDNGINVYVYNAKYGPVYQIGEDKAKDKKYLKLAEGKNIESTTIEEYFEQKENENYPRLLGQYNGKDVLLKKGKFGFYIFYNDINCKLKEGMDENLTLEQAKECIFIRPNSIQSQPVQNTENVSDNQEVSDSVTTNTLSNTQEVQPRKVGKYFIKNGPYGPYVQLDKIFASIPQTKNPNELTEEECKELIENKKKSKNTTKSVQQKKILKK